MQLLNFPTFYGNRRSKLSCSQEPFHRSLSWARSCQSITLHPISLRSMLIFSTHPRLRLPSGHFGFASNILCYMLHAMSVIFLDSTIQIYFVKSISYEAPRYAVFSNHLSLHVSSSEKIATAPCYQSPSVCSSINVRGQVSHSCRTVKLSL
jgi:hypothetical protein